VWSSNESLVWIWISGVANAIPLMCVYLMLVLLEEHAKLEGSGCCVVPLFFGYISIYLFLIVSPLPWCKIIDESLNNFEELPNTWVVIQIAPCN